MSSKFLILSVNYLYHWEAILTITWLKGKLYFKKNFETAPTQLKFLKRIEWLDWCWNLKNWWINSIQSMRLLLISQWLNLLFYLLTPIPRCALIQYWKANVWCKIIEYVSLASIKLEIYIELTICKFHFIWQIEETCPLKVVYLYPVWYMAMNLMGMEISYT